MTNHASSKKATTSGKGNHPKPVGNIKEKALPHSGANTTAQEVKKLRRENAQLRKLVATNQEPSVPIFRPPKGASGHGFNLQEAMELQNNSELYMMIRRTVRGLTQSAQLDPRIHWHKQPKETIGKIIALAQARQPYLKRFPHGWATEEFIKSNLKNRRAYNKKNGYNDGEPADSDGSNQAPGPSDTKGKAVCHDPEADGEDADEHSNDGEDLNDDNNIQDSD